MKWPSPQLAMFEVVLSPYLTSTKDCFPNTYTVVGCRAVPRTRKSSTQQLKYTASTSCTEKRHSPRGLLRDYFPLHEAGKISGFLQDVSKSHRFPVMLSNKNNLFRHACSPFRTYFVLVSPKPDATISSRVGLLRREKIGFECFSKDTREKVYLDPQLQKWRNCFGNSRVRTMGPRSNSHLNVETLCECSLLDNLLGRRGSLKNRNRDLKVKMDSFLFQS